MKDTYWFVVVRDRDGNPVVWTGEWGRTLIFDSKKEAFAEARRLPAAKQNGFKVYRWEYDV